MEERQRFTGKNEEQALERAVRVLGVPKGELTWSVVSQEKGFLGLGGSTTVEVVVPLVDLEHEVARVVGDRAQLATARVAHVLCHAAQCVLFRGQQPMLIVFSADHTAGANDLV